MTQLPIACTLSRPDLRARRDGVLAELRAAAVERRWLPNGLALRFEPAPDRLGLLAEAIDLERQCCRFLTLELNVAPGGGPIWLRLTGPEGTVPFLAHELGFTE